MRLRHASLASIAAAALLLPTGIAGAAMPSSGTFTGTTSQTYQGKRGVVKASVKGRKISRLDIDVKMTCDQQGATDTAGLFVTGVTITKTGKVSSAGTFDRQLTSADGKQVVGSYTATLKGTFKSKTRLTGTMVAQVVYKDADVAYATCESGTVRFTANRSRGRRR
jgi:hypothetical protein